MVPPHNRGATARWWRRTLAPLGVPTSIIADDPVLLDSACAGYDEWRPSDPAAIPEIEIRLRLSDAAAGTAQADIRVDGPRLTLTGPAIEGAADARTGRARCSVPADLRDDVAALMTRVIDPILLFLLARLGRPPIHAAGIMLGDMAVLLAGSSGAGKSTLALAAAAQGMAVLSDDIVHVELEPRLRVWGFSRPIHVLRGEAPDGNHPVRDRAGKRKAAVALPPVLAARRQADGAILVVLDRGDRLALDPISAETALATLMRLDPGFDLLPHQSAAAFGALAAAGAWRLRLTADPRAAITLLRTELVRDNSRQMFDSRREQPGGPTAPRDGKAM